MELVPHNLGETEIGATRLVPHDVMADQGAGEHAGKTGESKGKRPREGPEKED